MSPDDLRALVQEQANTYQLPADLLMAQVLVESAGDPNALRYEPQFFAKYILNNPNAKARQYGPFAACSIGLLQVMVEVAYELGFNGRPEQLFDPALGLSWGVQKLAALVKQFPDDYRSALAAYNAGAGNIIAGLPYADKIFARARRA